MQTRRRHGRPCTFPLLETHVSRTRVPEGAARQRLDSHFCRSSRFRLCSKRLAYSSLTLKAAGASRATPPWSESESLSSSRLRFSRLAAPAAAGAIVDGARQRGSLGLGCSGAGREETRAEGASRLEALAAGLENFWRFVAFLPCERILRPQGRASTGTVYGGVRVQLVDGVQRVPGEQVPRAGERLAHGARGRLAAAPTWSLSARRLALCLPGDLLSVCPVSAGVAAGRGQRA